MKPYDDSKYRVIGIGERLSSASGDCLSTNGGTSPIGPVWDGVLVSEDNEYVFLRPLVTEARQVIDTFETGATRSANEGRGRFDLVPYEAMLSLARRYEMGAKAFGDRNWEKGQPLSRLLSSMRRHAHQIGYDFSEDHAGAVLWNAAAFVTMCARMEAGILPRSLDDIGWFINKEATK